MTAIEISGVTISGFVIVSSFFLITCLEGRRVAVKVCTITLSIIAGIALLEMLFLALFVRLGFSM